MVIKKVFAESDAKDLLAASNTSVKAILANCTTTIIFAENTGWVCPFCVKALKSAN